MLFCKIKNKNQQGNVKFSFCYRLVGDVLLCTGFLSYSGPFNQEFRDMLMGKWQKDMKSRKIPFTSNLNVTAMLVDAATVNIDCFDTIHQVCI